MRTTAQRRAGGEPPAVRGSHAGDSLRSRARSLVAVACGGRFGVVSRSEMVYRAGRSRGLCGVPGRRLRSWSGWSPAPGKLWPWCACGFGTWADARPLLDVDLALCANAVCVPACRTPPGRRGLPWLRAILAERTGKAVASRKTRSSPTPARGSGGPRVRRKKHSTKPAVAGPRSSPRSAECRNMWTALAV